MDRVFLSFCPVSIQLRWWWWCKFLEILHLKTHCHLFLNAYIAYTTTTSNGDKSGEKKYFKLSLSSDFSCFSWSLPPCLILGFYKQISYPGPSNKPVVPLPLIMNMPYSSTRAASIQTLHMRNGWTIGKSLILVSIVP